MSKSALIKVLIVTAAAAVAATQDTRAAGFSPIAINPASYNHDIVLEASAPKALSDAVTVTMDAGTNKTGATWYERGYNPANPATGIPPAGSVVTNLAGNHIFRMPPDYHANNVVFVGHQNGNRTAISAPATLTISNPGAFSSLSFLTSAGNGPVTVGYTIHYSDETTESGTFSSFDWFNGAVNIFNASGRVNMGAGFQNVGGNPAGAVFGADIFLGNPVANVTSIDLYFVGAGSPANLYNNGRAVVFAVSGAKDGSSDYTNTLNVVGFNADAVVEADGPPTSGSPAVGAQTNNLTATMDGGTSKAGNVWFEKGFYSTVPDSGIPAAGSTFTSANLSASYTMPPTFVGNSAIVIASNAATVNVALTTPAAYSGLSFLGAAANGDTFIRATLQFADGSSENNTLFVPDWFNRNLPYATVAFGRANPNNRTINNTPDQFVSPFDSGLGHYDYRGLTLPGVRLFDCVMNVTNSSGLLTNIVLNFTNGINNRVVSLFAVSGAAPNSVPPVIGSSGTPTPGQPLNSPYNNPVLVKRWEGSTNIVLSVTNVAGTAPIAYHWMKAPRGGGFRDVLYSFDYSPFVNIANGGRVSGADTSTLTINNALSADSADYLVVLSNPYGAVTSTVVTVELLTTNQSLLLGKDAGDVITQTANDAAPGAESVDHAIDRVAQKWLSDGLQSPTCCGGPLPFTGPIGFVVTPVSGASIPSAMRFYTANDGQGRDPFDYLLEGSNDGATWTTITGGQLKGTLTLPTSRNGTGPAALDAFSNNCVEVDFPNATGYKQFRVSITNNINGWGDTLMQVAEIELLGTFVPAPPVWVRQPEPTVVAFAGSSPVFAAKASGLGSLAPKYQWYRNNSIVPGATGTAYTLANAQSTDSGASFTCTASNSFGTITSSAGVLTIIPAPAQPYPAAVLTDNPLGFWRLNEPDDAAGNNGVVAHDYRGGHNGSYSNTVLSIPGYNGTADSDTAAQFGVINFTDSYVDNIKDVDFTQPVNGTNGGRFSVEAWVYGINQTVDAAIVTKGYNGGLSAGTGTGTEQFVLDVSGNPRRFRFIVRDAAGNGTVAQSSITPLDPVSNAPRWHHLLGVCDQPNGTVSLYVDGQLNGRGAIGTNVGILSQTLPMTIGSRKSTGAADYDNQWNGTIDDVAIYGTALSASQAQAHFYAGQQAPVITLQPTNQTTPENVTVTFNSAAYGAGTLGYQWYLSDGANPTTPVAGQISQNLSFTTTAAQSGNFYQLVVTNQYGATTGAVAQLNVVGGAPSFFVDLNSSDTFDIGHIMQLNVVVGGTAPFTYQWQKNGVNIVNDYRTSGAQSDTLVIGYAKASDSANYRVLVSNNQGTTPSQVDAVTVTNTGSSAATFNAAGNGWSLQGTTPPIMTDNRLELTSGLGSTARAGFLTAKQNAGIFNASFVYVDTTGGGADGATFTIQNDTRGAAAVGAGGGALGYGGITPSVALAMNIYAGNTQGIGFLSNGQTPGAGSYTAINPVLLGQNTDPIQVNISYSAPNLRATFIDLVTQATFTTNRVVDIPAIIGDTSAYFGFTAGDGGVSSTQVISNFTMSPPSVALNAQKAGNSLVLSWPASTDALLKSTPSLSNPVWTDVTAPLTITNGEARVTVSPLIGNQFYRLEVYP